MSSDLKSLIADTASGAPEKTYTQTSASSSTGWTSLGTVTATTDTTAVDLPRAITTSSGWKLTPSGTTATFTCTSATPAVLTVTSGLKTGYIITVSNSGGAGVNGAVTASAFVFQYTFQYVLD